MTASRMRQVYRWLLRLLPFDFRSDFGGEMEEVFEMQREEAERSGGREMARLWWQTVAGIVTTAPREHLAVLRKDVRYGMRMMRRSPGFAVVAVLTLALGIGVLTTVFSFMDAFILRPLPFPDSEELVHLWQTDVRFGRQEMRVSVPNFVDWKTRSASFEDLGGYYYSSYRVEVDGDSRNEMAGNLTPNLMAILGTAPVRGRALRPGDENIADGNVIVVSEAFWRRRLAGRPEAVGSRIRLDDTVCTIVGIMPRSFVFPFNGVDMWRPLSIERWRGDRVSNGPLLVVGRLGEGHSLEQARTELEAVMADLVQTYPQDNQGKGIVMRPLRESLLFFYDMFRLTLIAVFSAAGFVMLIVCANLGNLQLTRAAGRSQEVAVRTALGAGRLRLIRQLMTENLLLAAIGAVLGTLGAYWMVQLVAQQIPGELFRVGELAVERRALLFSLAAAVTVTLLFGLAPALQATRTDLVETLKQAGRGVSSNQGGRWVRSGLVALQVALAVVLLAGSALMLQTFNSLMRVDPGFQPEGLVTADVQLPAGRYSNAAQRNAFYQQLQERISALASVESSSLVNPLPLNFESHGIEFEVPGRESGEQTVPVATAFWIAPDYFHTVGTPVLRGREFEPADDANAPAVVVINSEMARRYWPGEDPVGQLVVIDPRDEPQTARVIGVVADSKSFMLNEDPGPQAYLPLRQQSSRRVFVTARARGDIADATAAIREEIRALAPELPATPMRDMNEVVSQSLAPWLGGTAGLSALGVGALLLAAMGIYGVISYSVGQRAQEIRIRLALGARGRDVFGLVFRQGIWFTLLGVAAGLAGSLAVTRVLQSLLFGVGHFDPLAMIGMPLLLIGVAALACLLPARRAVKGFAANKLAGGHSH